MTPAHHRRRRLVARLGRQLARLAIALAALRLGAAIVGTAVTALVAAITPDRPPMGWPRTPHAMRGAITRLAPALRANSVTVEFARAGHDRRRVLTLRAADAGAIRTAEQTSASSASSAEEP